MSAPSIEHERRRYPRYQVHKIVSYTYGGKKLLTLSADLAMGGMKIKTHYRLPENKHLDFRLVLGDKSIPLKGRIVYNKFLPDAQNVSGIQFIELSAQDSALVQEYISVLDGMAEP